MEKSKEEYLIQRVRSFTNKGHIIERKDGPSIGHCIRNPLEFGFKLEIYESQELENLIYEIKMTNPLDEEYLFSVKEDGELIGYLQKSEENKLSPETWSVLDEDEELLCTVEERSVARSILRDYVIGTLPINYDIVSEETKKGLLRKKFSIYSSTYVLTLEKDLNLHEMMLLSIPLCMENL